MPQSVVDLKEHESGAKLQFANPDDPDDPGLNRYFGVVSQYDRARELEADGATFEAAGETWRFNHNPETDGPTINYWQGKIKTRPEDMGDAYYEYNIPVVAVDSVGEKKVNFQFRPGLPNATHVETGDQIGGIPQDLPEGLRVQIASANVHPNDYLEVLTELFRILGIHTGYLDDIHPWSRVTGFAIYVRIDRALSEERIVDRNGLLERLARFSSVRRGKGEWKWDNEEIIGHRESVTFNPTSLTKFYEGHAIGKLLKSYHMKHPTTDQGIDTYHPKLEVQWNKQYSPVKAAHWHAHPDELDRHDVQEELETFLYHALHWADLPLEPDPDVYIEDAYFTVEGTERDLDLAEDPTHHLADYERDLATTTILSANLSKKQEESVRTIMAGGQSKHVTDVAETAGVSESTVRRTITKLSDVLRLSNGVVSPEDDVIAGKITDIFYSIDTFLDRSKGSIQKLTSRTELVDENSVLGRWARRYAVSVDDTDPAALEIAINLGKLTEYQLVKIVRAGYDASKAVGSTAAHRFRNAQIRYTTETGEERTAGFGRYGHQYRFHGYPLD